MSNFFKPRLTHGELYLLIFTLLLQLLVAALPDPFPGGSIETDIDNYRDWCRALVLQGLDAAYWGNVEPRIDYPPLIPYLYIALGSIIHFLSPEIFSTNEALNFLIKIPAVACNVLISYIILVECKSRKIPLNKTTLLALMVNVPLIFDTSYWGQTDSVLFLLLLGCFLALQKQQLTISYVFFTLACFTKPLAWPFSLLILLVSGKKYTPQQIFRAMGAATLTAALVLLPFALEGNFVRILNDIFFQHLDVMPYISVSAHNLWWIVATKGSVWTDSSTLLLDMISYKQLAILFFLMVYSFILLNANKKVFRADFDVLQTAALVAITFFVLSPHMHENHLFNFFPLAFIFMLASPQQPHYKKWYLVLMAFSTFNMAFEDPYLFRLLQAHSRILLVEVFGLDPDINQILELLLTRFVTKLNALICVLIFIHLCWHELREHPMPKTWSRTIGFALGATALARVII